MKRALTWMALATALAAVSAAPAALHRLELHGQLQAAGGTRPVTLRLLCEPDPDGGAISVELWVPQANKLKDFDYDDFDGPDAVAGDRACHACVSPEQAPPARSHTRRRAGTRARRIRTRSSARAAHPQPRLLPGWPSSVLATDGRARRRWAGRLR